MINFKKTLSTDDIVLNIKKYVNLAILYYNSNNDVWKSYVRMSYYQFETLYLVAIVSDAFTAYEELVQETGYRKLYKYKDIFDYILKLIDVE